MSRRLEPHQELAGQRARTPVDITCYVNPGWAPRIRAASQTREWMDGTPERFAYRCLPLDIANAHGWELLSPCAFEAEWNGGSAPQDVTIRVDPGYPAHQHPVALFGQGVLTFHVEGLMRTPPGINLWVGGSPNSARDGIAPLSGIIETDWAPYSFTMNWRFTRAYHIIRFEENEPFCFFFPVERGMAERAFPRIRPLEEAPELKQQFETWSASRDAFQARMVSARPTAPADKWQKFYFRGTDASGESGAVDHQSKIKLSEFSGAQEFHREPRAPLPICPHLSGQAVARRPEGISPNKLEWIMDSLQRLDALSARHTIQRYRSIDADTFLDRHYSANWPALISGLTDGWPAKEKWTPAYLKDRIGSAPVQVQSNRSADPDFERHMASHSTNMAFDAFIDRISRPGAGNDTYLTAYNSAVNRDVLAPLQDDLGFINTLLTRDCTDPHGMLWIGPPGTFTPLHHDLTNNLLLQISGSKRVLLMSPLETPRLYNDHHVYSTIRDIAEPDLVQRFPRLEGVRVHQVDIMPGDALFIPLGWWHQITALDFSITITHTNFHWPNDFSAGHPSSG